MRAAPSLAVRTPTHSGPPSRQLLRGGFLHGLELVGEVLLHQRRQPLAVARGERLQDLLMLGHRLGPARRRHFRHVAGAAHAPGQAERHLRPKSEGRSGGKEFVRTGRSRLPPYPETTKQNETSQIFVLRKSYYHH